MSLTQLEKKIIILILLSLLVGWGVNYLSKHRVVALKKGSADSIVQATITSQSSFTGNVTGTVLDEKIIKPRENSAASVTKKKKEVHFSLDLNKATRSQLIKIKGIGPHLAESILQYKEKNGRFKNIKELIKVKGIGKNKLKKFSPFFHVVRE